MNIVKPTYNSNYQITYSDFCAYSFNAKEKDYESGFHYYGSRYYSSELSIWNSTDPMADKYPSLTPYNYCANNPVKLIDPNGEEIEQVDYYDLKIRKIGTDGIDNGKVYIIRNTIDEKLIKKNTKQNKTTDLSDLSSNNFIELPSQEVRAQMVNIAYKDDGNSREYGGVIYSDLNGVQYIKEAIPGNIWTGKGESGEINIMNFKEDANKYRDVGKVIATFHSHFPGLDQKPSETDISNTSSTIGKYFKDNYLITTGTNKVYIYDKGGIITYMHVDKFKNIRGNGKITK